MTEKHRFQLEEWKINISERMQSGRSITEWCSENNVSMYKYYYWQRELQKESITEAIKSLPEPVHEETPTFVEITKPVCKVFPQFIFQYLLYRCKYH